ncbi:MAG TPA: UdgX family uracil-DNA binding protein [Nitrospira sp.]|nr:UdgX family uracil-DNA binding protein [Nitrospira sp.]
MLHQARFDGTYEGWRRTAEALLAGKRPPEQILWIEEGERQELLAGLLDEAMPVHGSQQPIAMPARLDGLARIVSYHRDSQKWPYLYSVWWRWLSGEKQLLQIEVDPEIFRLRAMERQVRKAAYRMDAFVRFRCVQSDDGEQYVAWHRPDHPVLRLAAPAFVSRFRSLHWSIFTPDLSAHWDRKRLRFGPGVPREAGPSEDDLAELWRTYYGSVFNPARLKITAMKTQMPVRHWHQLPEASIIAELIKTAPTRVEQMIVNRDHQLSAEPFVPGDRSLSSLLEAVPACQGCTLYRPANHSVFGEGPHDAKIVLVGEQPGTEEDLAGKPFVGPAGAVLDRAIVESGLNRANLYLTNAVKHFKFIPVGKFRRHQRPSASEVTACRPWLEAELAAIKPSVIVCLGATAARSLLGYAVPVLKERGRPRTTSYGMMLPTIHPSALLRVQNAEAERRLYDWLVGDLKLAGELAR